VKKQKDVQLAAKKEYDFAFECELASMTVAEFIRWNPHFDEAEAEVRIAAAKAKVARRAARSGEKLKLDLDEETGSSRSWVPPWHG
jgi:hypothetical protein